MTVSAKNLLGSCETLMLDMDGTLLDLAFDNYIWLDLVPDVFAAKHGLSADDARAELFRTYRSLQGTLDWYCLDHWSERLDIDVMELHRAERGRIDYLPGAKRFLETVASRSTRVLLVTNSHTATLDLKAEVTGLDEFFDGIYSAHDLGHPKEDQAFWTSLRSAEDFKPETTLFVDDNTSVLQSAQTFGLGEVLQITRPDTGGQQKPAKFAAIDAVADLL